MIKNDLIVAYLIWRHFES